MNEEALFVAALEKQSFGERQAFLKEACAGDSALRMRVERLIAAHQATLGILDQPAAPRGWSHVGAENAPMTPAIERAGTTIAGRYRLLEEIGAGGMGTVWKAEQTQPIKRTVAIKLIKAGMDSRTVLSRFDTERQALALMEHPNIATVLDGGTTENGRPFFVMEYVQGVPITRHCDDARLPIQERLALFMSVCRAVQHAHTKGVIHRDLKPSNILVSSKDGQPVPKVIDFGLAKAIQNSLTGRTLRTADGVLLGTPLYMSPEQADLNNPDVDARTDIYALGVILYELLTGTTPLERQRFQEAAWHEFLILIKQEEPPLPSARLSNSESLPTVAADRQLEPRRLTKLVRGELDWIAMKCLEKDRGRRYETALGLARDVERFLADESVEACPPSAGYRLGKFIRRNKGTVLSASIILLVLIGGIAGTTWGLVRADRALKAEARRADGEKQARSDALGRLRQLETGNEILASIFRDLDPHAEDKEGRPLRSILGGRLDKAAAQLDGDAVGDRLVVAELQDRLGQTYLALGHAEKAKLLFAKALATRTNELGPVDRLTLATQRNQALAFQAAGEPHEAVTRFSTVKALQANSLGADDPDTLATQGDLALVHLSLGNRELAVPLLEGVLNSRRKQFGPDSPQTLAAIGSLAMAYVGAQRGDEAIPMLEQLHDVRVKTLGPAHIDTLGALDNLAFAYQAIGKMRQSLVLYEKARDLAVPSLGPDDPLTLTILNSIAHLYRSFRRFDEAIAMGEQVRAARIRMLGSYHPHTVHTLENIGLAYMAAGKPELALPHFQQAVAGLEQLKFNHGNAGRIVGNLCTCLEKVGKPEDALSWGRKWLAIEKTRSGPESTAYAATLLEFGERLMVDDRYLDAEPILRECVDICRRTQPDVWQTYYAQSMLGGALMGQKNDTDAEPFLLQGYEGLKAREDRIPLLLARHHIAKALEGIVQLYKSTNQPEKATAWRSRSPTPVEHKPKL